MKPPRRTAAFGLALLLVLAFASPAAAARGGNADAAAKCEEGGYLNWTRADGSTFRNEGACVSYAARGGTLVALVQHVFARAFTNIDGIPGPVGSRPQGTTDARLSTRGVGRGGRI